MVVASPEHRILHFISLLTLFYYFKAILAFSHYYLSFFLIHKVQKFCFLQCIPKRPVLPFSCAFFYFLNYFYHAGKLLRGSYQHI